MTPPVLFLIFNRPDLTALTFEQIRKAKPAQLFVAADGPRPDRDGETAICEGVRRIIEKVDWPCEVKTLFRDKNLGCRRAVSEAISWFFAHVDEGIILEDDCVPHESFFTFCNELLERYREDRRVLSIGGSSIGYSGDLSSSYGFTSFMNMWGWASWADRANNIDYTLRDWGGVRSKVRLLFALARAKPIRHKLDYRWYKYWKLLFSATKFGEINTWDYQWIYYGLMHGKCSIFPATNMVSNVGFSSSATHTINECAALGNIDLQEMDFPLRHPRRISIDSSYQQNCVEAKWTRHWASRKEDVACLIRDIKDTLRRHLASRGEISAKS